MPTLALKARTPRRDAVAESRGNPFSLPRGEALRRELTAVLRKQREAILRFLTTGRKAWAGHELRTKDDAHPIGPLPAGWPDFHDFGLGSIDQAWRFTPLIRLTWESAADAFAPKVGLDPDQWSVVNPHTERMIGEAVLAFSDSMNGTTSLALDEALAKTRSELVEGVVTRGEALTAITKRISGIFDGAEKWRARRIAWTETSRAVHAAQEQAAIASGVVTGWKWLLSSDACPTCVAIAARAPAVRLGHAFAVIGSNPHYSQIKFPPCHPHCNCSILEVLDTDPQPEWRDTLHQPAPATEDEHAAVGAEIQARDDGTVGPWKRRPAPAPAPAPAPKPARVRKPAASRKPKPPKPPEWPDLAGLKLVKPLGGSTGAELVEDEWGRKYVRKRGNSPDHIREEAHADAAYRALGVKVPESKLYDDPAGPVKLAKFVEGTPLRDVKQSDPALYAKAIKGVRKGFAVDALLGNWDVIGDWDPNILVTPAGEAYRIDNGAALRHRGQGARKTAREWGDYPTELWTLRDPARNASAAGVFGDLTIKELAGQIDGIDATKLRKAGLPADLLATLDRRADELKAAAATARTLLADRFEDSYVDGFCKHGMGLRKTGIAGRLPTKMVPRARGDVEPLDEHGRPFDHLRGPGSIVEDLRKYVDANGGNYETVRKWASAQAGSSWSDMSRGIKAFYALARTAPDSAYYWKRSGSGSAADCRRQLDAMVAHLGPGGRKALDETFQALHAFTYECLRKTDFPGKAGDKARVIRTEDANLVGGTPPGGTFRLKRGVLESASIFRSVSVHGSAVTIQELPLHRVVATYWQERAPGQGGGMFLGDRENEFLCLFEGSEPTYNGTGPYSTPH